MSRTIRTAKSHPAARRAAYTRAGRFKASVEVRRRIGEMEKDREQPAT